MTKKKMLVYGIFFTFIMESLCVITLIEQNWSAWTKVQIGSDYSLDDIEDGQAVLKVWSTYVDYIVVDKYGRWKQVNLLDDDVYGWSEEHINCTGVEFLDEILKNDEIPYQLGGREVGRKLLEWAINIEPFEMEVEYPHPNAIYAAMPEQWNFWVVIGSEENRELLMIGSEGEERRSIQDIRIMLIRSKLEQLEKKARDRRR